MVSTLRRERLKIYRNLSGIRNMERLPGIVVIIDPSFEHIAVAEAVICGIPIVALTDTDTDPDNIDIVIPGNDDAMNSIDLVIQKLANAVASGKEKFKNTKVAAVKGDEADETTFGVPETEAVVIESK